MKDSVIGMAHAAVYSGELHEEPDVSPTAKTTDASKLSLPIGWVAAIVVTVGGFGISQALGMAALRSDVRDILTRMEYENQKRHDASEKFDAQVKMLEAKIESSGLRSASMSMAQELSKQKGK